MTEDDLRRAAVHQRTQETLRRSAETLEASRYREPVDLWQPPAEPPQPQPAPEPRPVVEQVSRSWVDQRLTAFAEMLGEECGRGDREILARITGVETNLEQRVADLTARLAAAEALVADRAELSRRVDMLEGLTRQLIGAQLAERRGQRDAPEPPQPRALSDWSTHPIGLLGPSGRLPE